MYGTHIYVLFITGNKNFTDLCHGRVVSPLWGPPTLTPPATTSLFPQRSSGQSGRCVTDHLQVYFLSEEILSSEPIGHMFKSFHQIIEKSVYEV